MSLTPDHKIKMSGAETRGSLSPQAPRWEILRAAGVRRAEPRPNLHTILWLYVKLGTAQGTVPEWWQENKRKLPTSYLTYSKITEKSLACYITSAPSCCHHRMKPRCHLGPPQTRNYNQFNHVHTHTHMHTQKYIHIKGMLSPAQTKLLPGGVLRLSLYICFWNTHTHTHKHLSSFHNMYGINTPHTHTHTHTHTHIHTHMHSHSNA